MADWLKSKRITDYLTPYRLAFYCEKREGTLCINRFYLYLIVNHCKIYHFHNNLTFM